MHSLDGVGTTISQAMKDRIDALFRKACRWKLTCIQYNFRSCHAHCPAPFQATATMLLPGEVTATAWLLAAYTVTSLRQTVLLPGKCTVWRALTG